MKDPAFLFYPGDYLRDTQCLSETVQVAYDRIMCEHMRNISITQAQLNFFTKNFSDSDIEQLKQVLKETPDGYQIEWVADSITKRKAYSASRRKNRSSKSQEEPLKPQNISSTYVSHMENENGIEDEDVIIIKNANNGKEGTGEKKPNPAMPFSTAEFSFQWNNWKNYKATQHNFSYHSAESEQAALLQLNTLSYNNETTAIAILHQSMSQGWKGLFELKQDSNAGKQPAGKKHKTGYSSDFQHKIAKRLLHEAQWQAATMLNTQEYIDYKAAQDAFVDKVNYNGTGDIHSSAKLLAWIDQNLSQTDFGKLFGCPGRTGKP